MYIQFKNIFPSIKQPSRRYRFCLKVFIRVVICKPASSSLYIYHTVERVVSAYLSKRDALCGADAMLWSRHFCVDHQLPQVTSSHQYLRPVL